MNKLDAMEPVFTRYGDTVEILVRGNSKNPGGFIEKRVNRVKRHW
jgi:hypothetical protein